MSYVAPASCDEFSIAIVCALALEFDAVSLLFDEFWANEDAKYKKADGDRNQYTMGRVGKYNVVLVLLASMGKGEAASVGASLRSSYRALKLVLLVGVCGGATRANDGCEILLGDVIISNSIVQCDFGRRFSDKFVPKDTATDNLGRPNQHFRRVLATLETEHVGGQLENRIAEILQDLQTKARERKGRRGRKDRYRYPGAATDMLFQPDYRHKHQDLLASCICSSCATDADPVCDSAMKLSCADLGCENAHLVARDRLIEKRQLEQEGDPAAQDPAIHIGTVASEDTVLKSAVDRDKLSATKKAIAFEMEGPGLWDEGPCIIVKGVCDYADSHKNKNWQDFAAATAASGAKALLEIIVPSDSAIEAAAIGRNTSGAIPNSGAAASGPRTHASGPSFGNISGRNVVVSPVTTGGTVTYNFS